MRSPFASNTAIPTPKLLAVMFLSAVSLGMGVARAAPELPPVPHPDLDQLDLQVRESLAPAIEFFEANVDEAEGAELAELYGALGMHYQAHELQRAAEVAYNNALKLDPKSFRWLYYMGFLMEETGAPEEAMKYYSRALLIEPDYTPGRLRLAGVALEARHDSLAARQYERVLEADEDDAAARFGMGRLAANGNQHEEAVELFQKALERQPQANAIHRHLARSLQALGRSEEADSHLAEAGERKPFVPDPMLVLMSARAQGSERLLAQGMQALQQGQLLPAKNAFSLAISINPLDPAARISLGRIHLREGELERAEQEFRKAIEIDPEYHLAYFNLGDLLIRQDRESEAVEVLEHAAQGGETQDLARAMLADTLMRLGRYDEAAPIYATLAERPREQDAQGPDPMFRQGLAQAAAGDCVPAMGSFAAALNRDQENPAVLQALVRTAATCPDATPEQRTQALRYAELLYDTIPRMQTAETLAMALAASGRYEEAVQLQAQAIFEAVKSDEIDGNPQLRANMERYESSKPAERPWPEDHPVFRPGAGDGTG